MGFLARFFSGWDVNTSFLAVCLVYLVKTERRLARLEGVVEIFFDHIYDREEKGTK